jgi:hypothetical protein
MLKLSKALIIFFGLLWLLSGFNPQGQLVDPPILFPAASTTGGGGGNDITFRGAGTPVVGNGGNATPGEPASSALNDGMISVAICDNAQTITLPSGWTSIASGSASTTFKYNVAWIRRGASAPSLTWVITGAAYREVYTFGWSGCVTSGNIYEAFTAGTAVTGSTQPNPPSVTTVNANAKVIAIGVNWNGSGTAWVAPASYTIRSRNTAGDDVAVADRASIASGGTVEDPGVFTGDGSSGTLWAITIALQD